MKKELFNSSIKKLYIYCNRLFLTLGSAQSPPMPLLALQLRYYVRSRILGEFSAMRAQEYG